MCRFYILKRVLNTGIGKLSFEIYFNIKYKYIVLEVMKIFKELYRSPSKLLTSILLVFVLLQFIRSRRETIVIILIIYVKQLVFVIFNSKCTLFIYYGTKKVLSSRKLGRNVIIDVWPTNQHNYRAFNNILSQPWKSIQSIFCHDRSHYCYYRYTHHLPASLY